MITQWAQTNFLVDGGEGLADVTPAVIKSDLLNGKSYTQHIIMMEKTNHYWNFG